MSACYRLCEYCNVLPGIQATLNTSHNFVVISARRGYRVNLSLTFSEADLKDQDVKVLSRKIARHMKKTLFDLDEKFKSTEA